MSTTNDSLLAALASKGFAVNDNQSANGATAATGTRLIGSVLRVTNAVANGVVVLPSTLSNESPPLLFVVNDSTQTIKLYPLPGEYQNGTANQSLSIPAGEFAVVVRVPPLITRGGGGGGTTDWRSAVVA